MGMGEHSIRWLFLSTDSRSNWISMLVFENPMERPVEQGQEPTTNSTHMWYQVPELNLWEERALTTANPTFPIDIYFSCWNCCLVTCFKHLGRLNTNKTVSLTRYFFGTN